MSANSCNILFYFRFFTTLSGQLMILYVCFGLLSMRWIFVFLILLIACSQSPKMPASDFANSTRLVFFEDSKRVVGESCRSDSDCALPLKCVHSRCLPSSVGVEGVCSSSDQCLSGQCTDGRCARFGVKNSSYWCRKRCDYSLDSLNQCRTVCNSGSP